MTEPSTQAGTDTTVASPAATGSGEQAAAGFDGSHTLGTNPPTTGARTVTDDDRAVIAVFPALDAAHSAVIKLAREGFPVDKVSIIGKDLESEIRVNGFVTTGDIAGPSAATGAWVGGLFGVLSGTALLFIPGAGPLVVFGPLVAGAVGAAEGAVLGGVVGALLGHFVEKKHLPKYEELVRTGNYLVVVHGTEEEVSRAQRLLADMGSTDVQRHDQYRGVIDRIGPIEKVYEGMRVVDANGEEVGKVEFVKLGDPQAASIEGQDEDLMPALPPPFAERLLRIGYALVDRKGLFARDAYIAATDIERVEGDTVYLNVPKDMLLTKQS